MIKDYFKIFILRTIGNFFLLSAMAGVVLTFQPVVQAEINYRWNNLIGQQYVVAGDVDPCGQKVEPGKVTHCDSGPLTGFGRILSAPPPLAISPVDPNFDVVIPKIGANSRVIANVDPGDENAYLEALKLGVAHAAGSVYPGQVGNSVLFAHSVGNFWEVSRWNAVFYLLRELNPGDEVDVFYQGQRYVYVVYDKQIVDPDQVGFLQPESDFAKLTLQTCWPPGTTLKRLLVFARLRG